MAFRDLAVLRQHAGLRDRRPRRGRRPRPRRLTRPSRLTRARAALVAAALAAAPAAAEAPPGWRLVYDFMVQDVCVDGAGRVLAGASPLDGRARCPAARDLAPGEPLPYHKHDRGGARGPAEGYQRSDSYPARLPALGVPVVQTFDFGRGARRFGAFDPGDGGQLIAFSARAAAIVATEDGGAGLQLFVGAACSGRPTPGALLESWIVVGRDFRPGRPGRALAHLRLHQRSDRCPTAFDRAETRWRTERIAFARGPGRPPALLETLVSEHFGGADPAAADHLERFYFTRELGLTRWERWEQLGASRRPDLEARARRFADTGRCDPRPPPPERAERWRLVDCREWTTIVPAAAPAGDPPHFWLDRLARHELTAPLFAPAR